MWLSLHGRLNPCVSLTVQATRPRDCRYHHRCLPADSPGAKPGRPLEDEDCSLTILCPDVEDGGGIIDDLSPADTLATVREKLLEEFDEDQLPDGVKDGSVDFFFKIGSIRCSTSQESKKRALDIKTAVTIVAKKQKAAPPPPVGSGPQKAFCRLCDDWEAATGIWKPRDSTEPTSATTSLAAQ